MVVFFSNNFGWDDSLFSNDFMLWSDVIVVSFQTISDRDGHLFSNYFVLRSGMIIVYFQITLGCDDGLLFFKRLCTMIQCYDCLFSNIAMMIAYSQVTLYYNPMWWLLIFKQLGDHGDDCLISNDFVLWSQYGGCLFLNNFELWL